MFSSKRIILRTNKILTLREILKKEHIVFLSACYGSGKTVLLQQLQSVYEKQHAVAFFDCATEEWGLFSAALHDKQIELLIIDHLHRADHETLSAIAGMLNTPNTNFYVLLAGRQKMPAEFRSLYAQDHMCVLTPNFLMFTQEEIIQLFLEYNISLDVPTTKYLLEATDGSAIVLRLTAIKMMENPGVSLFSIMPFVKHDIKQLLLHEVFMKYLQEDQDLLLSMAPLESFTGQMAAALTHHDAASQRLQAIAESAYLLDFVPPDQFVFSNLMREALCEHLSAVHGQAYIAKQHALAASYYDQQGDIPNALKEYAIVNDQENIRKLLLLNTTKREGSGFYIEAMPYYLSIPKEEILASPVLMQGLSILLSLTCHAQESERWYDELKKFCEHASADSPQRKIAQDALNYLDIALPHHGTKNLPIFLFSLIKATHDAPAFPWMHGTSIVGNSPSIINGGKDFSAWMPHAHRINRLFINPIISTKGVYASGAGNVVWGEALFEMSQSDDYQDALRFVHAGLLASSEDMETQFAAIGVENRILIAQGSIRQADELLSEYKRQLPPKISYYLRANLEMLILHNQLLQGHTYAAIKWLNSDAPNEKQGLIILDRYRYMLKLRLYIIEGRWEEANFLIICLKQYFNTYKRTYMYIQLKLLEAVVLKKTGNGKWQESLNEALALAKKYRLIRVIADEGMAISDMIVCSRCEDDVWYQTVCRQTKAQAAQYPRYLLSTVHRPILTDKEYAVYQLLISGCRNAKIAATLNISECTVKMHVSQIYKKMGVSSRAEAINRASELGDI